MPLCIKVDNLTKYYRNNLVIKDLNLMIDEGEIVIFQGPSGIGKSTFLRCLTYLEPFQDGTVSMGNLILKANMDERTNGQLIQEVRKKAGFVFQFFNLFPHLTVLENLTIAPLKVLKQSPECSLEEAMGLLCRVGLEHKADSYPAALSGGQRQRVAIARALAMHPKTMLFDEPTSSLDPEMKEEVARVIEDISHDEGLTMLIVTHEPAVVDSIATRIVKFGERCAILDDRVVKK